MRTLRSARALTLVGVAFISILVGIHAFGMDGSGRSATPLNPPAVPLDPAVTAPPATARSPRVAVDDRPAAAGRPPLPLERGGPFGSRRTTGGRAVALTFDDGPDPRYTPQALALLRSWRVKATFCLVGVNVRAYPQLVRAIVADGHTLCNHSWDHDLQLGGRPPAYIRSNLARTNETIHAAVPGVRIAYYRQPGGRWTTNVVAVAWALGMTSLHWAVDPQDWRRPGASAIAARANAGTGPGAIVLLHDAGGDRSGTISALRSILPSLTRRFRLITLPTGSGAPSPRAPGLTPT